MDPFILVSTLIAMLVAYGGVRFVRRYVSSQDIKAQLEAKDATIETNQQSIEALEKRLTTLEAEVATLNGALIIAQHKAQELTEKLEESARRYRELERYTAPEAVQRFENTLTRFEAILIGRIDTLNTRLDDQHSDHLDHVEGRADPHT